MAFSRTDAGGSPCSGSRSDVWTDLSAPEVWGLAREPLAAFAGVVTALRGEPQPQLLELVRLRIATLLWLPTDLMPPVADIDAAKLSSLADWPTSDAFTSAERTCLGFAEQFVMDVAATGADDRAALGTALGSATFGFVQAVYVLDHGTRLAAVLEQLFGFRPFAIAADADRSDLWPAIEAMLAAVARLHSVDALTSELVRLRGARLHQCRLCSSRRRVSAVVADPEILEVIDPASRPDLDRAQRAAINLADVILLRPSELAAAAINDIQQNFSPAQAIEIALLVAHNAANKIAVALGADAPAVTNGVEYFEIGEGGDYRYELPAPS
jgi:alkylhydroperoxidase family enzyme